MESISISLDIANSGSRSAYVCQSKVCGDHVQGIDCGDEVANWLSEALNIEGLRLLKQNDAADGSRFSKKGKFNL